MEVDDRRCRIGVLDHGAGCTPEAVSPGSLLDGGQGLVLVRALVDTRQLRRDADGRHRVTFEKSLAAARA